MPVHPTVSQGLHGSYRAVDAGRGGGAARRLALRVASVLERVFRGIPTGPNRRKLIGWLMVAQGVGLLQELAANLAAYTYANISSISEVAPVWVWAAASIGIGLGFVLTAGRYRPHVVGRIAAVLVLIVDAWFWGGFWASGVWSAFWHYTVLMALVFGEVVYVPPKTDAGQ